MFLVLSVACFSAGLIAFAYSSHQVTSLHKSQISRCRPQSQNYVTSTLTTVFSAFSSFGLLAVSAWFTSERIVFDRHKGKKWLSDVLDDFSAPFYEWVKTAPEKSKTAIAWSAHVIRRASVPLSAMVGRNSVSAEMTDSIESAPPPYGSQTIPLSAVVVASGPNPMSPTKSVVHFRLGGEQRRSGEASGRPSDASPIASPSPLPSSPEPGIEGSSTSSRLRNFVRGVAIVNGFIGLGNGAKGNASLSQTESNTQSQLGYDDQHSGEVSGRPSDASPIQTPPLSSPEPGPEISAARTRFRDLARSAVMVNRLIGLGDEVKAKISISITDVKVSDRKPTEAFTRPRSSRVAGFVPKLQNMSQTQDIAAHAALVRHMEVGA